jgi:hypothetical protein
VKGGALDEGDDGEAARPGSAAFGGERDSSPRIGIALSGGGVRSAAFSLGAIQALQEGRGLLKGPGRATYLSAVSGGSYTAAAFAMVAGVALDEPSWGFALPPKSAIPALGDRTADHHPLPPHAPATQRLDRLAQESADRAVQAIRDYNAFKTAEGWCTVEPGDPLMPGTPEADHIRRNAQYLSPSEGSQVLLCRSSFERPSTLSICPSSPSLSA